MLQKVSFKRFRPGNPGHFPIVNYFSVIKGFINPTNITKTLLNPVPMDMTTDYIACSLQASLRESFKDEIYQIAVVQKRQQQQQVGVTNSVLTPKNTMGSNRIGPGGES